MAFYAEAVVNLDEPADRRWRLTGEQSGWAAALLDSYTAELGGYKLYEDLLTSYAATYVSDERRAEIRAIAESARRPYAQALLGNLYYDALKSAIGCTAFAVDTPDGVLHARNLDWWSANGVLERSTLVTRFERGGETAYRTVGWPGFVGALSGVAPGRFAITLNSVTSDDPPRLAQPVVLLIRDVLETAPSFDSAVQRLSAEEIACDCLLLVSGTRPGQKVVIERTPTRAAVRETLGPVLAVTNDYHDLAGGAGLAGALGATSCPRYERALELFGDLQPTDPDACLRLLSDRQVRMDITVQQMVFQASTGRVQLG